MLYRIHIEQRFDKRRAIIEAVKELASDFVILTGVAYFGNNHRPCQIIEINHEGLWPQTLATCLEKLKKILNMPQITVTQQTTMQVLY